MALLVRKQAPFVSVPTTASFHTLFQETQSREGCEPQTMPQESSESVPVLDKSPNLHQFPYCPHMKNLFLSVLISVHLWFQVLRRCLALRPYLRRRHPRFPRRRSRSRRRQNIWGSRSGGARP